MDFTGLQKGRRVKGYLFEMRVVQLLDSFDFALVERNNMHAATMAVATTVKTCSGLERVGTLISTSLTTWVFHPDCTSALLRLYRVTV